MSAEPTVTGGLEASEPRRARGAAAAQRDPQRRTRARGASRRGAAHAPVRHEQGAAAGGAAAARASRVWWSICRGEACGWPSCPRATSTSCSASATCWSGSRCTPRWAAARRPDLSGLRSAVEDMERAAAEGAALEQAAAHRAFHLALVALAGHHHLLRVYEPVLLQLQLYMATNMRREARDRSPREGAQRHRGCTTRWRAAIPSRCSPSSTSTAPAPTCPRTTEVPSSRSRPMGRSSHRSRRQART